jgi:predicted DNA-binding protein
MNTIVIDIPPETHKRLEAQARREGKTLKALTRELIETALQTCEGAGPKTALEVLQSAGRVHPLSETLRRKIIPGVTLDEVRKALSQAAGPSLSELVVEQRGPKL